MGGETTEMSATTTRCVIEAAHFDAGRRSFRTGRRHKLTSEAVQALRARRRPDAARPPPTGWPSCSSSYGGGPIEPGVTVVGAAAGAPTVTDRARPARPGSPASPSTPTPRVAAPRAPSAATVDGRRRRAHRASPPSWRPDLTDPYDLVEEVARVVGYDEVPSVLPAAPAGRGLTARAAAAPPGRPRARRAPAASR